MLGARDGLEQPAIHRALARDERTRALLVQIYTYILQAAPAEDVMNAAQQLIEQGRADGRADGLREAISHVLAARKLPLRELGSARMASCTDVEALTAWLERAATAASEAEVFAGSEGT